MIASYCREEQKNLKSQTLIYLLPQVTINATLQFFFVPGALRAPGTREARVHVVLAGLREREGS
jgi:hypothetical protein